MRRLVTEGMTTRTRARKLGDLGHGLLLVERMEGIWGGFVAGTPGKKKGEAGVLVNLRRRRRRMRQRWGPGAIKRGMGGMEVGQGWVLSPAKVKKKKKKLQKKM